MHSKLVAHVNAPLPYLSNSSYLKLLARYPDLTKPPSKEKPVKHNVVNYIVTNGHPCSPRSRQLSPEKLAIFQEEIDYLLETGVISRLSFPFSSPLYIEPIGETGKFRLVGDYRVLNQQTIPDLYLTPSVQHLLHRLHGSTIFSKIDLVRAYHQIPLSPESRQKTAIICPLGVFEYNFYHLACAMLRARFRDLLTRCARVVSRAGLFGSSSGRVRA